jgi:murein tripeptide amidase MpaA
MRNEMVFKIVPMLNPDGVIHGNYRASVAGVDLNRYWSDPSKQICPEIYATKSMIN